MEEQYQQQLLKYQQPSEFFKQVKKVLEFQKKVIDGHVKAGTGDIWISRQRQVYSLLECLNYTENRAQNYYKNIFGAPVFDDSMLYAECVKFCNSAERVFWQQWVYNANALIYKLEEILNSLKYDDSMVYLNARLISTFEEQLQLKMPANLVLGKQLKEAQDENTLLKKQLAEVTQQYNLHTKQITELQQTQAKMEQSFQKLADEHAQLLQTAERHKKEAEQQRKAAAAHSPSYVRPKHVAPLFHKAVEQEEKTNTIATTNHTPNLCCSISFELMKVPVMLIYDGHTYEKEKIEQWINQSTGTTFKSPKGGKEHPKPKDLSTILIENIAIKNLISEYIGSPRNGAKESSPERKAPSLIPSLNATDS